MSKIRTKWLRRVNILLGAIIAMLGVSSCKTAKSAVSTKDTQPAQQEQREQQEPDKPIEVKEDRHEVICLYGPPPMLIEERESR